MNQTSNNILHIQIQESIKPLKIFLFDDVESVFDVAFELAFQQKLAMWDSAIAKSQSAGHGQLGRPWISPPGNIYACIRLPHSGIFRTEAATPFLGLLCSLALRSLCWPVILKWPNDLVLWVSGQPGKVGGILLEERGDMLLAGIGINLNSSPTTGEMRDNSALNSTSLNRIISGTNEMQPVKIWTEIVKHMMATSRDFINSGAPWQKYYNEILLWKDMNVEMTDGIQKQSGQLLGIVSDGAVQLSTEYGIKTFNSGSLALVAQNAPRVP